MSTFLRNTRDFLLENYMKKIWIKPLIITLIFSIITSQAAIASYGDSYVFTNIGSLIRSNVILAPFLGSYKTENSLEFAVIGGNALASRHEPPLAYTPLSEDWRLLTLTITAYSSSPDETDSTPFITASGSRTRDGVVATNVLPFGTKVKIPELFGDKVFTVEDRMNRRYTERLDIWFPSKYQAKKFGKQLAQIVVFEEI